MFKHLLIPTDGSELSHVAVSRGVQFAKEIGARITGLTVSPPYHYLPHSGTEFADSPQRYNEAMQRQSQSYLDTIQELATSQGVPCQLVDQVSEHPYEEIVRTAEARGCDAIFMSSHGRRGIRAMLMGSETHKVLTHSKIPVVVWR
jgi:nucleotide-binding universal stress UspA family protein